MDTGVGVWVLLAPELPLGSPVPGALLQVPFDQVRQPSSRHHLCGRWLPPVRVDRHGGPLGQFTPCDRSQLGLAVGADHHARSDPGRQHPHHQPRHQRALTHAPSRRDRPAHRLDQLRRIEPALVQLQEVPDLAQHLALPLAWPFELLQRGVHLAPREREHDEVLRIVRNLRRPQLGHQLLLFFRRVLGLLHQPLSSSSTSITSFSITLVFAAASADVIEIVPPKSICLDSP